MLEKKKNDCRFFFFFFVVNVPDSFKLVPNPPGTGRIAESQPRHTPRFGEGLQDAESAGQFASLEGFKES